MLRYLLDLKYKLNVQLQSDFLTFSKLCMVDYVKIQSHRKKNFLTLQIFYKILTTLYYTRVY